jgi:RecA/RadA recombinase
MADADEVLRVAAAQIEPGYCLAGAQTALAVLLQQQQIPGISLSASSLDSMLQGGVKLGTVTEFYGVPGVGKTQLGIQLAVNVQVRLGALA